MALEALERYEAMGNHDRGRAGRALPIAMVTTLCVGVVSVCVPSPRSPSTAGTMPCLMLKIAACLPEPSAETSIEPHRRSADRPRRASRTLSAVHARVESNTAFLRR